MRIIDSEAHPLHPTGVESCFPLDVQWRYPHLPPMGPQAQTTIGKSVAAAAYDVVAAQLLAKMNQHGIEKAVIMRGAFPALNQGFVDIIESYPDRFIAFATWDAELPIDTPPYESSRGLLALERALASPKFYGAGEFELGRFSGLPPELAYSGFIPTMKLCQKYHRPIMFHMCYDPGPTLSTYKNPLMLEPLITLFPDVPVMIAHMGKYDTSYFEAALMLARKFTNVFLTTSTTRTEFVERAVSEIGPERIIFGSDWSVQHGILGLRQGYDIYERNLEVIREARISDADKELIFSGNLVNLLNIT